MRNIILIGMPGAGKSTIGVVLAKVLGKIFCDTDLVIQNEQGILLHEIISKVGLDGFLEIEEKNILQLALWDTVIATGGSVVYSDAGMRHLKSIGTLIYLKVSYEVLSLRVADLQKRGVALKDTQSFLDLYLERVPLYEKYADITIEIDDTLTVEVILEKIQDALLN